MSTRRFENTPLSAGCKKRRWKLWQKERGLDGTSPLWVIMPLGDKMHSQRNFVLNIGFGRSPTSVFEVGFVKSDSKNCELVPTCPACGGCKCEKFFLQKITVRFKLNLKTDGPDCKMIFKFGKHVERFHSIRKQGRRIDNVCICKPANECQ